MNRKELIDELESLAERAKLSDDDSVLAAAGVLYSLCGSLHAGTEARLLGVCAGHAEADIKRLTAPMN